MREMPIHSADFDIKWPDGPVVMLPRYSSSPYARCQRDMPRSIRSRHRIFYRVRLRYSGFITRLCQFSRARGVVLFAARVSVIRIPVSRNPHQGPHNHIAGSGCKLLFIDTLYINTAEAEKRFHLASARHALARAPHYSMVRCLTVYRCNDVYHLYLYPITELSLSILPMCCFPLT